MAKYNVYPNQIPQISATGDDGKLNIHLKVWFYAETIQDLVFNKHVEYENGDFDGCMNKEITVEFNTNDKHLMSVLRNKNITQYCLVDGSIFPIPKELAS